MVDKSKRRRLPKDAALLRMYRNGASVKRIAELCQVNIHKTATAIEHALKAEEERRKKSGVRAVFIPRHIARHSFGGHYLPGATLPAVSMHTAFLQEVEPHG